MIRVVAGFLVCFALGALALPDEADDLRRRVRELAAALEARPQPAADPLVERRHPVADLTDVRPDVGPYRDLDLMPSPLRNVAFDSAETAPYWSRDELVEFLRAVVAPATWEEWEGAAIEATGRWLVVRNLPRVQEQVATLLARLRERHHRPVDVELWAVRVPDDDRQQVAAAAMVLPDDLAARLLDGEVLGHLRLRGASGRRAKRRVGRVVTFAWDYEVQIAQEAVMGQPSRHGVFEGCAAVVLPLLDERAGGARLDVFLDRSKVARPWREAPTEHGPIDLPSLRLTRVRTSFWAPLGRTVVVGGSPACLFLARVERVHRS